MKFKNIHIGQMIMQMVTESEMEIFRICKFLNSTEEDIKNMYLQENLPTDILLKWSKLLEYDFFRIYSQHLILYSPPIGVESRTKIKKSSLPKFRKNIYTKDIIDFILESLKSGEKTKKQIIDDYKIPKTTLYKWIYKYNNEK